jgi:hypothetical protein
MIRPFTVLCLFAACGSGLYLYSEKHRTALLDRDIGRVIHATEAAQARTGLLRAEWALLNEPGRLQDMAGRYLTLHPMAPTQFVQLASLAAHLPAPGTPVVGGADEDDASNPEVPALNAPALNAPALNTPASDTPALGTPASRAQGPDARVVDAPLSADVTAGGAAAGPHSPVVTAKADVKPAPKLAANAAPRVHAHRFALADQDYPARDGMMAHGAPLPLAAQQPVGARVYSAMARPMRAAPARPTIVAAAPRYASAQSFTPAQSFAPAQTYATAHSYVPSALGGAGSLPPPTPYGR